MENLLSKENRTSLMGISILLVFLHHLALYSESCYETSLPFLWLFSKGNVGVDFFLLTSVFGLSHAIKRTNIATFYKRRFRRLYPLYIAYLSIVAIFFCEWGGYSIIKNIFLQISGLIVFSPLSQGCNYFEWYTPTLTIIYITFPLLFKMGEYVSRRHILVELICLCLLAALSVICIKREFVYYNAASRLPIVFTAIMVYFHSINDSTSRLYTLAIVSAIISVYLAKYEVLSTSLCMPVFLIVLSQIRIEWASFRFFAFIGKYSFEIYLAQQIATHFLFNSHIIENYYTLMLIVPGIVAVLTTFFHLCNKYVWRN